MSPLLGLNRRLQAVPDAELRHLWRELAPLLQAQADPVSGRLPARYQRQYDQLVAEFARRGVQLQLW